MTTQTLSQLQYLVVGTGRSGTLYAAKLLTALGYPCGHERIFNGGDISEAVQLMKQGSENSACSDQFDLDFEGRPVAESSYMAVPFLEDESLNDCGIIHIVRDPLKVILSFLNNLLFFREERSGFRHAQEQFLYKYLPQLELLPDPISRACFYYLRWNQLIEESIAGRKYMLYQVEQGPEPIAEFLGLPTEQQNWPDDSCNSYDRWPEHMKVATDLPRITEEEIRCCFLWKEVAMLANKYGYSHETKGLHRLAGNTAINRQVQVLAHSPAQAAKPLYYPLMPRVLREDFLNHNIVQYKDAYFALHRDLGPVDLTSLSANEVENLKNNGKLIRENSLFELRVIVQLVEGQRKQTALHSALLRSIEQDRQNLESLGVMKADLRHLKDMVRQLETTVMRHRPWYRKLGSYLRLLVTSKSQRQQSKSRRNW